MDYIVFDLEWNQGPDYIPKEKRPLAFEIIEIGAVKLNDDFEIVDMFSEFVHPMVYRKLNHHTKQMVDVSMKQLEAAEKFTVVMKRFRQWCGDNPVFCTWGSQDLTELQRNIYYHKMKALSDRPIPFYNVQNMFARYMNEDKAYNLESAVDITGISKDTPFHRAYGDAYYTAKILKLLHRSFLKFGKSYDLYHLPPNDKAVAYDYNGDVNYLVSREYKFRDEIKSNKKLTGMVCAKCDNKAIRPKVRWFSNNTKNYYGACVCKIHGPLRGFLRIRHTDRGGYYMEKFMYYCTPEEVDAIKKKKTDIRKKPKAGN